MANRSKPRRRSRKRRPAAVASTATAGAEERAGSSRNRATAPAPRSRRAARTSPTAPRYGERPSAPWHPLPLSELLIVVGAVAVVLGMRQLHIQQPSFSHGGATLLAGLLAVGLGSFEVALREHRSGYRSHTIMLAMLPILVLDSLVVLLVTTFTTAPRLLSVGLIAIDLIVFACLFRLLRARFLDARHARVLREG